MTLRRVIAGLVTLALLVASAAAQAPATKMKPTLAVLMIALGLGSLPILAAFAAPAWTPAAARSPLRQIWSFDTKG